MKERRESKGHRIDPARKQRRVLFAVYGAALVYFVLKQAYFMAFTGGFPDSVAHSSYLIYAAAHPFQIPDFRSMTHYCVIGTSGGLTQFAPIPGTVNYLAHPPLYYWLMSLAAGVRFPGDGTAAFSILRVQAVNAALTSGTMILAFRLGYTRLKGRPPLTHAVYAFAVAALPMLAYVGASLNNDNLAFPAMVIFFTGLLRYEEDRTDLKTYLLLGAGFLLGSFSKLTTALLFLVMLAACLIADIIRTRSLRLIANRYFAATLPFYLAFLAYELYIHREYGAWLPSLSLTAPEYFLTTVFYVPPDERVSMSFLRYLRHFAGGIGHTWSSLYGHNATLNNVMNNHAWGLVYWIPPAAAALAAVYAAVRRKEDRLALPVTAALLVTGAYHLYTGWTGFLSTGYLGGAQARYYLPMIVPAAYLMCGRFSPFFEKHRKAGAVMGALLIAAWIAGDAPRLMILYGFAPIA